MCLCSMVLEFILCSAPLSAVLNLHCRQNTVITAVGLQPKGFSTTGHTADLLPSQSRMLLSFFVCALCVTDQQRQRKNDTKKSTFSVGPF